MSGCERHGAVSRVITDRSQRMSPDHQQGHATIQIKSWPEIRSFWREGGDDFFEMLKHHGLNG